MECVLHRPNKLFCTLAIFLASRAWHYFVFFACWNGKSFLLPFGLGAR